MAYGCLGPKLPSCRIKLVPCLWRSRAGTLGRPPPSCGERYGSTSVTPSRTKCRWRNLFHKEIPDEFLSRVFDTMDLRPTTRLDFHLMFVDHFLVNGNRDYTWSRRGRT